VHRDAAKQVQVFPAVGVPDGAAFAAHQHALRGPEDTHQRFAILLQELLAVQSFQTGQAGRGGHCVGRVHDSSPSGTIWVPMPAAVKISSRMECGILPSTTAARSTPPSTAFRQASILGIMPDCSPGSSPRSSPAVSDEINEDLSGQFAYSPSTSVRMTSREACRASATAAAAVSALTLST